MKQSTMANVQNTVSALYLNNTSLCEPMKRNEFVHWCRGISSFVTTCLIYLTSTRIYITMIKA